MRMPILNPKQEAELIALFRWIWTDLIKSNPELDWENLPDKYVGIDCNSDEFNPDILGHNKVVATGNMPMDVVEKSSKRLLLMRVPEYATELYQAEKARVLTHFVAKNNPLGYPKILECDDSVFDVSIIDGRFSLRRVRVMEKECSLPDCWKLPLGEPLLGDSLIVYKSGLVILCNENGAIIAISCTNGLF